MQKTRLGNTDLMVSILGLGTVKFGRNTAVKYPAPFNIPDDKEALTILNTAADCGINLLDTAPAYGDSELRLGKLLKNSTHKWLIATKVGEVFDSQTGQSSYNFSPEYIQESIENSLRRLQRERLDIVLIHSDGNDLDIIQQGALETLNHLKQKGLIDATGMSTKTVKGGIAAAQQSDIVMVTHNLYYQEEQAVIDYACRHKKSIFIKKAFASGHNTHNASEDTIRKSFDCIYQHKGINSIILGSINPTHIQQNAEEAIASFASYNP
jgi:aryl-alcohol dehydrogenase-like predicted oxidoreductase